MRGVREREGITLEKASQDSKIVKTLLEAIELDDYKNLPPPVYLKGLVKKYAQYLHLDEEKTLDFYQKSNGRKISSGSKDLFPKNRFARPCSKFSQLFSSFFSQLIKFSLLIFFLGYFLFELSQFVLPAQITLHYPPKDFVAADSSLEISGKVIRSKILYFQGEEISFDKNGAFREQIILNPGVNILELKALNSLGRQTILRQNVVMPAL